MIGNDLTKEIPIEKQRAMMQRDKTFAWMSANNEVVVFQPEKEPRTFLYHPKKDSLTPTDLPQNLIFKANAHALWGSLAYKEDLYSQKERY